MKIRPVEAELFHADGQRDMTQLTAAFRKFAKAPKNAINWKKRFFLNINASSLPSNLSLRSQQKKGHGSAR
jgi:hypothetical protein